MIEEDEIPGCVSKCGTLACRYSRLKIMGACLEVDWPVPYDTTRPDDRLRWRL